MDTTKSAYSKHNLDLLANDELLELKTVLGEVIAERLKTASAFAAAVKPKRVRGPGKAKAEFSTSPIKTQAQGK